MDFEIKLKELIKQKYGSVQAFASSLDMPYSTINNIFTRGILGASVQNVIKICEALNLSIEPISKGELVFKEDDDLKSSQLSIEEENLIKNYRNLSEQGQEYIRQTMYMATQTYKKMDNHTFMENKKVI